MPMHFEWEQPLGSLRADFGQPIVFLVDMLQRNNILQIICVAAVRKARFPLSKMK
jgi:hypothetical protein